MRRPIRGKETEYAANMHPLAGTDGSGELIPDPAGGKGTCIQHQRTGGLHERQENNGGLISAG